MFYSIAGNLACSDASVAVIECGGVGFKCIISLNTAKQLPSSGENVKLNTYLQVREDSLTLFGFYDIDELECFKQLISVSGVGAKAAIAILSQLTPSELVRAVSSGDVNAIKKAQGVGMKIAQRVVLDLNGKLKGLGNAENMGSAIPSGGIVDDGNIKEAADALVSLGYSYNDAVRAITGLDKDTAVEELIREGLKILSRQV